MKIKNKKVIVVTILSCITLSMCGCKRFVQEEASTVQEEASTAQEETSTVQEETSIAQEETSTIQVETSTSEKQQEVESINASKINNSNFFFEDITKEKVYHVRHSFFTDAIPDEVLLQITMESQYESGKLYRIKCDFDEDFPGRYDLGYDRFSLGYFYVQNDSATIYRIREGDMTNEIMDSEEKIMSAGTVVCQEQEKKDILGEGENGWHEWIAVDDDRREYHSYNNLTETGFYEQFVWEQGKGLIYYTSGFGADKDMMEIAETESKRLNPIISESTNNEEEK